MSELTGRTCNNCSLVTEPFNQNGMERAKTNKKNLRGDLLRDAKVGLAVWWGIGCLVFRWNFHGEERSGQRHYDQERHDHADGGRKSDHQDRARGGL